MGALSLRAATLVAVSAVILACGPVGRAGQIDKTGRPDVSLKVAGDIVQACGMGVIAPAALGEIGKPGVVVDADMALECNVPFDLVVTSTNGGLRNVQHPQGLGPYSGVQGYEMTVALPVQTPAAQTITASYSAQDLVTGKTISSAGGVAFNGAHIHLVLAKPPTPGLAAGDYSETIEFSISPST